MSLFRIVMLVIAAGFVSACSTPHSTMRNASPTDASLPASAQEAAQQSAQVAFMPNASINSITVDVPNSLTVSEANSYFPRGDIVWRGDIFGDRHEQVKTIIERSAAQLKQSLTGTRPVDLHIRVTRFHGLSEKARYSTGGVHNINFILTVTDPATGVILRGPKTVVSNLSAFGGKEALAADQRGETQKMRVTGFITQVLKAELTTPGGHVDTEGGFFVALNRQR